MTVYVYVCPECGRPHTSEEFGESRFCSHCGKFLSSRDKRVVEEAATKKEKILKTNDVKESIEKTYRLIQRSILQYTLIDSLEVVNQVEQYRQFWKPEETNIVLLAESHVYTDKKDSKMKCDRTILHRIIPNYPLPFVRFVYCLGYGENELLIRVRTDRRNAGTPQYWKIFSSCVAESEDDLGFDKILKTGTPSLSLRLRNKVDILRKMKKKGVWLLDASIVGLYGSGEKDYKVTERILGICWRNYISDIMEEANPKHIIVIGKGVGGILNRKLRRLTIPFTVIPQPQARGTSDWQLENYRKYQRVCLKYH